MPAVDVPLEFARAAIGVKIDDMLGVGGFPGVSGDVRPCLQSAASGVCQNVLAPDSEPPELDDLIVLSAIDDMLDSEFFVDIANGVAFSLSEWGANRVVV